MTPEEHLDDLRDGEPDEGSLCQCVAPGCTCVNLISDELAETGYICVPCQESRHS